MAKKTIIALFFCILLPWGIACSKNAENRVVNIYNWADYIAPGIIEKFEKETGIRVQYDVFDTNEILEAKLMVGHSDFDVVFPTANPFFARQIQAKIYQKIDQSKLKNYGNLNADLLKSLELIDPHNDYGIPYVWGTSGFGYNIQKVKEIMPNAPIHSWKMVFDPKVVSKFQKCGVTVMDTAFEVLTNTLAYLHIDPNSFAKEDLEKAIGAIRAIRPYLRSFNSSRVTDDLANGDICLAQGWSVDILLARDRAKEAHRNYDIAYAIPEEGSELWFDMMAIPADAPHVDEAHAFIDFILRPDISAEITNYLKMASANDAAKKYTDKSVLENPLIYPPAKVIQKLFISKSAPVNYERLRTRLWARMTARK
ncbi:MAG: polyamine ABC transporter substrate-binding protein [Alphaproteobacteria bacterium]|nr:polyamine ABC transporter substrate-binding protein [Alphaproteobacteria bacterium]MBT5389792.1 polyamine ABC transporter substrate-binding protein [Alphaproteobacteria bacterium]MBT5540118.1 polyamine ABC transporter substrate-binding protein [Alphaproteobacteria bacterium]MBT5655042.1 polyamine ABC transporter substrate-binding protein [Alphaproteobacteria bacterium]